MRAKTPIAEARRLRALPARRCSSRASRSPRASPISCAGSTWGRPRRCWRASSASAASAQDEFALQSHQRAIAARERLREEIVPVFPAPEYDMVQDDVGPREGQTIEALAKLKPYFDRKNGTVTVGNSCQVTDGAVGLLIGDEATARGWPVPPLGRIRSFAFAGLSPRAHGARAGVRDGRGARQGRSSRWTIASCSRSTKRSRRRCSRASSRPPRTSSRAKELGRDRALGHDSHGSSQRERRRDRARPPGRRERGAAPAHPAARDAAPWRASRDRGVVRRRRAGRRLRARARLMRGLPRRTRRSAGSPIS